jgi:hypothetical protein
MAKKILAKKKFLEINVEIVDSLEIPHHRFYEIAKVLGEKMAKLRKIAIVVPCSLQCNTNVSAKFKNRNNNKSGFSRLFYNSDISVAHLRAGLPDGLFSDQKSQFG